MKAIQQFFKTISIRRLVVVFLAGVLIVTSTACGSTQAATPADRITNPTSASEDGMYPYKDTERDTGAADTKADRMVRQAEQRIQNSNNSVDEVTPDVSLQRQAEELGESAKQATEDAAKSAKRTAEDVQKSAKRAAEDVGQSTQRAAENTADNTQRGLKNLQKNAEKAVDQVTDTVDQATN